MAVLGLWAFGHMISYGGLAHIVFFGSFALFAAIGGRLIDRRRKREMGADWVRLTAEIRAFPVIARPARPALWALRLVTGIALYLALIWLHPIVIGVDPLAF